MSTHEAIFFKTKPKTAAPTKLGGVDLKRLRVDAERALARAEAKTLDALLQKSSTLECVKMTNKAIVYLIDGVPMFFDATGRGDGVYPSVYALWRLGSASGLRRARTHSAVSPKILNGASLMLPGLVIDTAFEEWESNEIVEIGIVDGSDAFAVGITACSSAEARASGMKGVGVTLVHAYGDACWALGDKSSPSKSFSTSRIYPDGEDAPVEVTRPPTEKIEEKLRALNVAEDEANGELEFDVSTPDKMDAMFERCFAMGLNKVTDAELPMRCETFYANFVLPSRPEGVQLDLKHSTFKKQAKLFHVMEKKVGIIKTKLVHKIENVASVNREHALLAKYAVNTETSDACGDEAATPAISLTAATIDVSKAYRASTMYRPIFGEQALQNKDRLYSKSEARVALGAYVKEHGLGDGSPGSEIKLDLLLGKELFNKKEEWYGTDKSYPIDDLFDRLMGKLQPHTIVRSTRDGETLEYVKKGSIKPIHIKAEDRGRRKYITRVSGLESFCISPEDFSLVLKREFSAAVSIEDLPGKQEHGKELSIQGHVVIQLCDLLRVKLGVPAKYIDAQN
ncbi:Pseudouridine synthase/archaeosine transglycosylase [Ostreococcus tauri]|uniref:Pseudouridine synthase/archaeosine transglycosylase n=1 Tax=Ostreococcus tauri TaxID=70448 RepID=Q01GY6_OSTTA|nr:Pseudouridine synthase/archaeosine transglycosylase [Ostreococcus tauri]OUS42866.1 hypothetical protein BE221DRAFT_201738 [Ostreococcus tauri]CAL50008.1 Pseudouridine synthase/archaeosine transglycosylase [Ostreococcus tauri]|eukprot:XP_003074156.1 Pseudouridine synthase/archaeosine transglycosylase [Ostreococcus tauri]